MPPSQKCVPLDYDIRLRKNWHGFFLTGALAMGMEAPKSEPN
jgi:hypothetical protein